MIDHVGLRVASVAASKRFYGAALAPRGYVVAADYGDDAAGFGAHGRDGRADFWVGRGESRGSVHVCFGAKSRADVDAFYKAALAAGGKDNGAPGLRKQYHPTYYGAFVLDPDGNNVEAVHHG
jgi:catechol 2,3-dioxygenase-like lactoylglutathione lyase family enzyme